MSQTLSAITCKSQLQATMTTTAGRTNVISNPKLGNTISHSLAASNVDIAYSFKATGTASGANVFTLAWASGITDATSNVTFTMRDNPSDNSAQPQQDPEGIPVNDDGAGGSQSMVTLVAVQFETPATNTDVVSIIANAGTYESGPYFIPDIKFHGGDAVARSAFFVPRVAVSSITATCQFSIAGASGNSVTVTVFGDTA